MNYAVLCWNVCNRDRRQDEGWLGEAQRNDILFLIVIVTTSGSKCLIIEINRDTCAIWRGKIAFTYLLIDMWTDAIKTIYTSQMTTKLWHK